MECRRTIPFLTLLRFVASVTCRSKFCFVPENPKFLFSSFRKVSTLDAQEDAQNGLDFVGSVFVKNRDGSDAKMARGLKLAVPAYNAISPARNGLPLAEADMAPNEAMQNTGRKHAG